MKEIFDLFANPRFWGLYIMITLPLWFGIISCSVVWGKEILNDYIRRYTKGK